MHKNTAPMTVVWVGLLLLGLAVGMAQSVDSLTITEKDSGRAFTVKAGQKVVLDLRHPGSGGYDFLTPEHDQGILKLVGQRRIPRSDSRRLGDFGRMVYEFEVLKEGRTDLLVPIKRPWENQSKEYLRVKIKVVR